MRRGGTVYIRNAMATNSRAIFFSTRDNGLPPPPPMSVNDLTDPLSPRPT